MPNLLEQRAMKCALATLATATPKSFLHLRGTTSKPDSVFR